MFSHGCVFCACPMQSFPLPLSLLWPSDISGFRQQPMERASPGFSNSDSVGKSHCSRIFLFLPPSPPACVHPLLLLVLSAFRFPLKTAHFVGQKRAARRRFLQLRFGGNRREVHCHPGGGKLVLPQLYFPMSPKQLSTDLSPFLLYSWFIVPFLLCSVQKQCLICRCQSTYPDKKDKSAVEPMIRQCVIR